MGKKLYERKCRHCGDLVTFYHGEKMTICPSCGQGDYIKPETETTLFLLQKEWMEKKDKKILGEMYIILIKYVKSKIKKILNGVVLYDEDKLEEKAIDSVNLLMEYYLTKEDFFIQTSFMGYITRQINSTLYNKSVRFADSIESLNYIIDESNKKELGENLKLDPVYEQQMTDDFIFNENNEVDLVNGVCKLVADIHEEILKNHSNYLSLTTLVGIFHYMNRCGDEYKNNFYDKYGRNKVKTYTEQAMMIIMDFIKDHEK